jgi:hypothetical protein
MWSVYRSRFWSYQMFIVAMCVIAYVAGYSTLERLPLLFVVFQAAVLLGAWFGARVRRKAGV